VTGLPPPQPIRELGAIDRRSFDEEIRPAGQPVVLRGLGARWPAVQAAKQSDEAGVEYLLSFGPPRDVPALIGAPEIEGRFFYRSDFLDMNFTRSLVALRVFFDRLLRDRVAERPYALAVQSEVIPQLLPGFVEANHVDLVDASVQPRIWLGNRIQVAPHYDLQENIGVVVMGRRRFTLFPPDQLPNLYMGPIEVTPAGTPISLVDIANPDLERFPRYAEAANHAQSAVLEPGDGIYIPFHWWHGVDSLERVNAFVNYWWLDTKQGLGMPYDALLHALFALRDLPKQQRDVWRMVFDHLIFLKEGDPVAHLPADAKGVLGPDASPERLARMRATLKDVVAKL
jgi:hypothetical protein